MNCKVKQGCLTSENCCILLWLAFTLFPVSVVTAADNRKIDESQQKEVKAEMKGYVGDENGEPVIGATVLESGTQNGVITDVDGIFTIQLAKNASLTISYVGYQKKTVVVKDKKFISVNLTPDRSMMLDEVVVVGFGKQKKESLVGAVQAVKPEDLKMTSSNLSTSFAGNVPGIIAVQTQGEPGSDEAKFYIRGISTFGSNTSPLIILDGVEINATMMNNIPPESIASFSVLKDATATSLYGSRGANGVIIVTTKQGQLSEKMSVDIRFDNTFSMPTYVQKMADGPTYMDMYNEAVYNQAIANNQEYEPFYSRDKIDKTRANANPYLFPNNDWYSMLFKDFAVNQNLNISIKGGSKNVDYFLNAGIFYENVMKMGFGNGFGFAFDDALTLDELFGYAYGSFVLEMADGTVGKVLGITTADGSFSYHGEALSQTQVLDAYEDKLESVYACNIPTPAQSMETFSYEATQRKAPAVKVAKPKVLIPAFPGTNCEYDSAKAVRDAGAEPEIIVINNLSADGIARSVERFAEELKTAQMVFIPGGFSGGDEPDGSGKFITAFFRNAAVKEGVTALLEQRDGLMCGICNGFQALIKLGLVPYGKIIDTDETCPTLTFNNISRHQSRIVRTRVASNKSPWLALTNVGDVYNVPISHGEGKFLASEELIRQLAANGQIATQYVDLDGNATADVHFNPNGSLYAIEGITSPDGRVFGKMGHSERIGSGLYKNVPGEYNIRMFEAAVKYFR